MQDIAPQDNMAGLHVKEKDQQYLSIEEGELLLANANAAPADKYDTTHNPTHTHMFRFRALVRTWSTRKHHHPKHGETSGETTEMRKIDDDGDGDSEKYGKNADEHNVKG
jgi:hypothetical protein